MTFEYPAVLLCLWLIPIPVIYMLWSRRHSRGRVSKLVHSKIFKKRYGNDADKIFNVQLTLFTIAAILLVLAAARPRWGEREQVILTSGRNVLILLDVSRSMLANDVHPNRLERAKADISDLLDELHGDRAGIMAFRKGAVLLCPFTTDRAFLHQTLEGITIDSAPRGETDIGEAIEAALQTFENLGTEHNAIIMISDGEDLSGKAIAQAQKAGEQNIPIFCVGIGDTRGSTVPVDSIHGVMEYRGENVITKLDNETLIAVANASRGTYIPLQTAGTGRNTLGILYKRHVQAITAQEMQDRLETILIERYQLFLLPALLLLLIATALSQGRPARLRSLKRQAAQIIAAALILQSAAVIASSDGTPVAEGTQAPTAAKQFSARELGRKAQKAWKSGDFATATELYLDALNAEVTDPELIQTLRFNAALSSLKSGNAGKAAELFRLIASDPKYSSNSAEGLGVALFRAAEALSAIEEDNEEGQTAESIASKKLKLFEEAATAFQLALRDIPESELKAANLEASIAYIPKLREEIENAKIEAKYGDKAPNELAAEIISLQREIYKNAARAFTNNTPAKINLLEQAAGREKQAAAIWKPLSGKFMEMVNNSVTNEQQIADFQYKLDVASDNASGAANALENLDISALNAIQQSEQSALEILAFTSEPVAMLEEAMNSESNAVSSVYDPTLIRTPVPEQQMAGAMFNVFANTYGEWLDQKMPSRNGTADSHFVTTNELEEANGGASPDNMTITEAVRAEIDGLVDKTLGSLALVNMDISADSKILPEKAKINAEQALEYMQLIHDLLPKPPQEEQQQDDKQQQQDNREDQDQQQEQDEDGDESGSEDDNQGDSEDDTPPPQEEEDEESADTQEEPKTAEEEEAERIMAKVLEQEKSREEERRKRQRIMPPSVGERDW